MNLVSTPPLHVVFGAGQVGAGVAHALRDAGVRVRVVRRTAAPVAEGVEVVAGDARDAAFVRAATEGAAAIYHCMNPSAYTGAAWAAEFPAQGEALIAAARHHGARLVCLDNLYGYGVVDGPRTEVTPMGATGPKGRVRVAWDARLRAAGAEGLRYVVGRAGDFFGPGTADQSLFSAKAAAGLARGETLWVVGDADAVHAFSYVPAVVAGLVAMGLAEPDVEGRVYHLPVVQRSPRALAEALAAEAGGPKATVRALPVWSLALLAPFVPVLGELRETAYQWDRPFLVDDSAFRARFGAPAAPAWVRTAAAAA